MLVLEEHQIKECERISNVGLMFKPLSDKGSFCVKCEK
jgi:hypothetical protein